MQVQDLQKRVSELEQLRVASSASSTREYDAKSSSSASSTREYDAKSSHHSLQPPGFSSIVSSQLNCATQPDATNAGVAGPWMVGPTRYPELSGRHMRDAGVQVQLSTSVTDVVSVLQEHVQVRTEVGEKFDRSSSPVHSPPASKVGDEGLLTVNCSMKPAKKLLT